MNQQEQPTGLIFKPNFGVFHDISDDSYHRGYADGETAGQQAGYETGLQMGLQQGMEQGKQAEYDRFWDAYQHNGTRTNYDTAFAGDGWTLETFKPKYNISYISSAYMMFRNNTIKTDLTALLERLGMTLNFGYCSNLQYAFSGCAYTRICKIDARSVGAIAMSQTFSSSRNLETIDEIVCTDATRFDGTFNGLENLKNIKFDGVINSNISFPKSAGLTNASVQSIIDHLKDRTGATALTLTLHADVGARLTDAQKAAITAKNWTLVC